MGFGQEDSWHRSANGGLSAVPGDRCPVRGQGLLARRSSAPFCSVLLYKTGRDGGMQIWIMLQPLLLLHGGDRRLGTSTCRGVLLGTSITRIAGRMNPEAVALNYAYFLVLILE